MTGERLDTQSLCPHCLKRISAQRVRRGENVYLEKCCPDHGAFRTVIWQGDPVFDGWQRPKIPIQPPAVFADKKRGCPFDCGLCPDHHQRSCTVLLEVTERCDLGCPVCYADAKPKGIDPSRDVIDGWYRRARTAGENCNIQLSGGEPTLRDDLPGIVSEGRRIGFKFIQLNTNGLRLARDRAYVRALRQAGLSSVFLQFDGTNDEIYYRLRGRAMLKEKLAAIAACREQGIGVVLVPTLVPGVNVRNIGNILKLAMAHSPAVRAVHFQPISYFGRNDVPPADEHRLTLPRLMRAVETQSEGLFVASHFRPPGCENALCSCHANFLLMPGNRVMPLQELHQPACCPAPINAADGANKAITSVARQWAGVGSNPADMSSPNASGESMPCCGPDAPIGLDDFIQQSRTHTFSISAMAFQDVWNIALDRVRDCCIHVMSPDGRLIPFCLYNLTGADGRRLYRTGSVS